MKKITLVVFGLFCMLSSTQAQKVIKTDVNRTETISKPTNGTEAAGESTDLTGGASLEYLGIEDGFGLSYNLIIDHFLLSGRLISGETNSVVKSNEAWSVGVGYNYRYWLAKYLYVEGQAGVEYTHATLEYKDSNKKTVKDSNGDFGLFLTPRIGLKLFKLWDTDWGVVAGYRWDFNKFKFSKENTSDYFTIGLSVVM